MQPAVTRAQVDEVPVITVDTTVADQSYLTSFITGDNIDGGHKAAETLAQLIGNKGKVFIMSGSPSATTDVAREKGFREAIKKFPDIEIVGIEYANSQPATATSAVNTILLKYPDLAGIFALDGTSGTGTVAALRNANKAGQVRLVGSTPTRPKSTHRRKASSPRSSPSSPRRKPISPSSTLMTKSPARTWARLRRPWSSRTLS